MTRQLAHGKNLRKGRFSEKNRIYLVTSCCHARRQLFTCLEFALIAIEEINLQETMGDCTNLAYVVMPDHIHWLVQLGGGRSLAKIMNSLKGRSARQINSLQVRGRKVWQNGFHDHALRREEDLQSAANYLIHNPVRAGLVQRPDQYPFWGSIWHGGARGEFGPSRSRTSMCSAT